MPSGAKKRKAAKKKKEMAVPHQPDSPTDRPHGNGERESGSEEEGERAMESHGVDGPENGAGEEHREEIKEVMGSGEAGDVSVEAVEVVEVVEVTEKVEEKPEPEKEEEEEEDGQVVAVPIVQVSSVNEEVVEAIEGLAEEADAAVEAVVLKEMVEKSGAKESEEVIVVAVPEKISEQPSESGERLAEKISAPPMESPEDTPVAVPEKIGEQLSESDERLPETKSREIPGTAEADPAPLVAHRANLWNCCGLLEVFFGSQR
ncbi:chromo domain-containing protein cec-1 [Dioscorea cayenensis subsp. rotundata]|uniref:Chromo domain-containing protein cec-1 n=1 Tax=Dioscorea cayennensis subsp. rotundata TaxID=55577 RepID=A0AB40CVX2_DIOCR|nr:chromo domain-containing protein cec-1 [Dioscorea cayenensis subsp. rotundata]